MGKSAGIIGGVAGGIGGALLGGPAGAATGFQLGSGVGGMLGGGGGSDVSGAYNNAAAQQAAYAQQASQMAQFRPVGMTTAFGSSNFDYDEFGRLKSAGYTLTPELQGIRDRAIQAGVAYNPEMIGQMAQPLGAASQGLFGLGGRYIAQSPEEAEQRYMAQQRGLLAPGRAAEEARLMTTNFGRGTGGLGVQTGTGTAPSNPLAQALFNARAKQDDEIAARAVQEGRSAALYGADLYTRGAGLLGQVPTLTSAGYTPLTTQLGLAESVEGLGQRALDLSSSLGARQSTAGAQSGNMLLRGGLESAQTGLAGNIAQQGINAAGQTSLLNQLGGVFSNPSVGNWFGSLIGGGSTGGAYGSMGGVAGMGGAMGTGLRTGGGIGFR